MSYLVIALIIVGWLLCSAIAYAGSFAYYQGIALEYSEDYARSLEGGIILFCATMSILLGPLALLLSFFIMDGYKRGLRLW